MPAQAFGVQLWLAYALATWSFVIYTTILFYSVLYDNQFVKFGPNASLNFLYLSIDSWSKWWALVAFIMATQALKVLADEIISPWIINTVMDHKGEGPDLRYHEVQAVCQTYYFFSATVQFVSISVTVAQLDLVLVLITTDLLVSAYTTHVFIHAKTQSHPGLGLVPPPRETRAPLALGFTGTVAPVTPPNLSARGVPGPSSSPRDAYEPAPLPPLSAHAACPLLSPHAAYEPDPRPPRPVRVRLNVQPCAPARVQM
jgi:hypothetical protein